METASHEKLQEGSPEVLTGISGGSIELSTDAIFEAELAAVTESPLRRPSATYRIQIHGEFRLDDLTRIVDYLHDLGISDCYLSPYLEARPGSTHGYDVFDHGRISSAIGDASAHDRLLSR